MIQMLRNTLPALGGPTHLRRLRHARDVVAYAAATTLLAILIALALDAGLTLLTGGTPGWSLVRVGLITMIAVLPVSLDGGRIHLSYLRTNDELREQAKRDQQTNLLHHKAFIRAASCYLAEHPHAMLMIGDIDRFKLVNDRHGHQAGDVVIQKVADIIRDIFGTDALTGRLGGEEFAVLVAPPAPGDGSPDRTDLIYAEEWRQRVASLGIVHDGRPLPVTVSIGAARSCPGLGLDELYSRADRALYLAKAAGRNRVVAEDDPRTIDDAWNNEIEISWREDALDVDVDVVIEDRRHRAS